MSVINLHSGKFYIEHKFLPVNTTYVNINIAWALFTLLWNKGSVSRFKIKKTEFLNKHRTL